MHRSREELLEDIVAYMEADARTRQADVFRAWFREALTAWLETSDPTSFAPCDDNFRNPHEPAENFETFVGSHLVSFGRLGNQSFRRIMADEIRSFLSQITEPNSPFTVAADEATYVSDRAFEFLAVLHSLDRTSAVDWLCCFLGHWRKEGHQRDSAGTALPIVMFRRLPQLAATDAVGSHLAASMFDWSLMNTREPRLWTVLLQVVSLRLEAISRTQKRGPVEALSVIQKFSDIGDGTNQSLLEVLTAGYAGRTREMQRWRTARERLKSALVGISLNVTKPEWLAEMDHTLFSELEWKAPPKPKLSEARKRPARRRDAAMGMLGRIETSPRPANLERVRPELQPEPEPA